MRLLSLAMDVDRLLYQVQSQGQHFLRHIGAADSAFEHAVPEQQFRHPPMPQNDPKSAAGRELGQGAGDCQRKGSGSKR